MFVTCGRLDGWSATKMPMTRPRGLASEKARFEITKDFTDMLDWAIFNPESGVEYLILKENKNRYSSLREEKNRYSTLKEEKNI